MFIQSKPFIQARLLRVSTLVIQTDASLFGWGAVFMDTNTQGRWNIEESQCHINVLELKAIYFALKALCRNLSDVHLCVRTDSSVAVAYINKKGGSVISLHTITKDIWLWCYERNIYISAVHIAGKENVEPDNLSRIFNDSSEWMLKPEIFTEICSHFFKPEIDLFSSRLNHQVEKYVSWFPDPEAFATDAFSFSWKNLKPYLFPPFSVIPRVLMKLEDDQVKNALLIAPLWQTQFWFPKLMESLIEIPIQLPFCKDLLVLPFTQKFHPMNKRKLFLTACLVSGDISLRKAFHESLQTSYQILGDHQPTNNINMHGINGVFGVFRNKSIPLHLLQRT